jgi:branched-subunit amino acid ABC-type transport system permease component
MPRNLLTLAITALLLAGCAALDDEQLRICRLVLPVIHPAETDLREIRVGATTHGGHGVRIEYAAREPGNRTSVHWIACGFGGRGFEAARGDLVTVETDRGPLGEARLLFLKRFWLHDWEAVRDRQRQALPEAPDIPAVAAYAIQQAINAIALCAVYALLATAYALIYGLVGRLNLAFGEIAVIGAFGALAGIAGAFSFAFLNGLAGLAFGLVTAAFLASLWSWVVGRTVITPLHLRFPQGQPILVATVALAVALQEFTRLFQGEHWLPPMFNAPVALARAGDFVVTVTLMQAGVAILALVCAGAVMLLLARSSFGRAWRAYADDPGAAALVGIAVDRLLASTFLLAGVMAGVAGWIVGVYYGNVSPVMGTMLGLKALVAAVVGGIGSVPGAFLGGILVGLIEAGWSAYADVAMRDIVVYAILVIVFVLRPGGIFGFAGPSPRQV